MVACSRAYVLLVVENDVALIRLWNQCNVILCITFMYHIQELVSDDIVAMEVRHQHLFSQIRGSKLLIRLVSFWLYILLKESCYRLKLYPIL